MTERDENILSFEYDFRIFTTPSMVLLLQQAVRWYIVVSYSPTVRMIQQANCNM